MDTFKALGRHGDWFATVNGEKVPCAWSWWLTGMHYCDAGAEPGTGKWVKYIAAIQRDGKVALTGKKQGMREWVRDGYIGLFEVANIKATEHTLEFDLTRRLANLKPPPSRSFPEMLKPVRR